MSTMDKLTDKIVKEMETEETDKDEMELYKYGITQLLQMILNVVTVIVVASVLDRGIECLIFFILYMILRSYAGGYHADTRIRCYVFSCGILLGYLGVIPLLNTSLLVAIACFVLSVGVLFYLVPVENINKRLDAKEKRVFGRIARGTLVILIIVQSIFFFTQLTTGVVCIAGTTLCVCVMAVLGKLKLIYQLKNKVKG